MVVKTFIGFFNLDVFENLILNTKKVDFEGVYNVTYEITKYNWSDSVFWLYNFNLKKK